MAFCDLIKSFHLISVKSHNALVKHLKLMQNHEDFELKKLLFNILVSLSKDTTAIPVSFGLEIMVMVFNATFNNISVIS